MTLFICFFVSKFMNREEKSFLSCLWVMSNQLMSCDTINVKNIFCIVKFKIVNIFYLQYSNKILNSRIKIWSFLSEEFGSFNKVHDVSVTPLRWAISEYVGYWKCACSLVPRNCHLDANRLLPSENPWEFRPAGYSRPEQLAYTLHPGYWSRETSAAQWPRSRCPW